MLTNLESRIRSLMVVTLIATSATSAVAQQRWQHDFGASVTSPAGGTFYYGTNGAGVSNSVAGGSVSGSLGTGGESVGVGGCVEAYPFVIPHPAAAGSRAGGQFCARVTPDGIQTTLAPGIQTPTGARANVYYRNTYNPRASQPQQSVEQTEFQPAVIWERPAAQPQPQLSAEEMVRQHQAEMAARQHMAQYAYNPPADAIAPYTSSYRPEPAPAPVQQAAPSGGMTNEQFRSEVNQSMQEFYQAVEQQRQSRPAAPQPTPTRQTVTNSNNQPEARFTYNEDAPRRTTATPAVNRTQLEPVRRPTVPHVAPRQSGSRSNTASLTLNF